MYSYHPSTFETDYNVIENEILSLINTPYVKMDKTPVDVIDGISYQIIFSDLTSKSYNDLSYKDIQDMGIEINDYCLSAIFNADYEVACQRNVPIFHCKDVKKLSKIIFEDTIQKCLGLNDIFCYRILGHILCYVALDELNKMVKDEKYIPEKYKIGVRSRIAVPKEMYEVMEAYQKL